MSDSLGDGTGHPTKSQARLYRRWAEGGIALSIIGEVQSGPNYAEKPGNLVLDEASDLVRFEELAVQGGVDGAMLWTQLGHAGAMAFPPTSAPKGPSALDLPGLRCDALTSDEIAKLPSEFARTAQLSQTVGFHGVQIHAAHGFLLSQFLSPLFNQRQDAYGGSLENRMRLLLETIAAAREAVGPRFPIAVKLNATDQLEGGFAEVEALDVIAALDGSSVDLIDVSGGTYFPGAKSASDAASNGPYFASFAARARARTKKPLMLAGGFKTRAQAEAVVAEGVADVVGLARALVLEPSLPKKWQAGEAIALAFPRFRDAPEGGVTAWYTLRLTALAEGGIVKDEPTDLHEALKVYEARDQERTEVWRQHFRLGSVRVR